MSQCLRSLISLWVSIPECVSLSTLHVHFAVSQDFKVYFLECASLWSFLMYVPGWAVPDPFVGVHSVVYALCLMFCVLGSEVSVVIVGICPKTQVL